VGERSKIPRTAKAAVLADHRGDSGIQNLGIGEGHNRPNPRPAGGQSRESQQHQGTNHFALHFRAGPSGMAADQRALQLGPPLGRDLGARESPKTGRNPIVRPSIHRHRIDHGTRIDHRRQREFTHRDLCTVARHGNNFGKRQGADAHSDHIHDFITAPTLSFGEAFC
jgi:hypothetical protein